MWYPFIIAEEGEEEDEEEEEMEGFLVCLSLRSRAALLGAT